MAADNSIKNATLESLDALLELSRSCARHLYLSGIDQWDDVYPNSRSFKQDIEASSIYIYESQRKVLGCVTLNEYQDPEYESVPWKFCAGPAGVVHRMMVHPAARGKGIAKKLMAFVEDLALEKGYRALRLDAFTLNPIALGFYEKLKYERVGLVQFRKGKFFCYEKELFDQCQPTRSSGDNMITAPATCARAKILRATF